MKTSTQSNRFIAAFGLYDGIDLLAQAGYDALDLSLFDGNMPLYGADWRDACTTLGGILKKHNLTFNQAHTDFPTWRAGATDEENDRRYQRLLHDLAICGELGIPCAVVHPAFYPFSRDGSHIEKNIAFYRSLLPYAKEYGVKIAVENMYRRNAAANRILPYTCADPVEFAHVVDALDSEHFVACLDIGHVLLTGFEVGYAIRTLGHDRLHALHVHDVDCIEDLHTLPYQSKVDWEELIAALREIRYDGDLTLEADGFIKPNLPKELYLPAALFMAKTAVYLRDRIVGA